MDKLKMQIMEFLDADKRVLHKIYAKWIHDHAYLWTEFEDLDKLRHILLIIIRLFYEEHRQLHDVNEVDYEEFKRKVRELISNPDALLQRTRDKQIKEIELLGLERWVNALRKDMGKVNQIIQKYEKGSSIKEEETKRNLYKWHHLINMPEEVANKIIRQQIFTDYSTFVDPGKYMEYRAITPFAIYTHTYRVEDVPQVIREGGLLCTKERFRRGITTKGMSSDIDLQTGAAEFVFTRIVTPEGLSNYKEKIYPGVVFFVFEPDIVDRLDWYTFNEDRYGGADPITFGARVSPEELFKTQKKSWNYGNEQLFRYGIPLEKIRKIVCATEKILVQLILELRKSGIAEFNGRPIEKMIAIASLPDFVKISEEGNFNYTAHVKEIMSRYQINDQALNSDSDELNNGL